MLASLVPPPSTPSVRTRGHHCSHGRVHGCNVAGGDPSPLALPARAGLALLAGNGHRVRGGERISRWLFAGQNEPRHPHNLTPGRRPDCCPTAPLARAHSVPGSPAGVKSAAPGAGKADPQVVHEAQTSHPHTSKIYLPVTMEPVRQVPVTGALCPAGPAGRVSGTVGVLVASAPSSRRVCRPPDLPPQEPRWSRRPDGGGGSTMCSPQRGI